jgi:hypothetical protein
MPRASRIYDRRENTNFIISGDYITHADLDVTATGCVRKHVNARKIRFAKQPLLWPVVQSSCPGSVLRIYRIMKSCRLLLVLFLTGVFANAQTSPDMNGDPPEREIYLAKDDGKGRPGEITEAFVTTDVPIFCVVRIGSSEPATVRMDLLAADVPGVRRDLKVVSATYTTKNGENEVYFTGKPHGNWVAGIYRVDIFVNGELYRTLEFPVTQALPVSTTRGRSLPATVQAPANRSLRKKN